jgi:2,4-dienoyl-CoA reductase-like NADH-dependent reductase (Old Yellow Enzyme family)/thioredoxin reductase
MRRELKNLFSPIRIGNVEIANRVVMSPMATNLCSPDGSVTEAQIDHYVARARGGVGLIIAEDCTVGPNYVARTVSLANDKFIPGWKKLTETVHVYGTKIMPQIFHPSFNAPSALNNGAQPVAASPIPNLHSREIPRELTTEEILGIIEQFGETARRAKEGGCDGVQIHCAHMHHLLGSFLTPYYNKRTDEYGGPLEGRLRLPLEVIQRVRSKVGPGFAILVRISGEEYMPGGLTVEQTSYLAPLLVEAGADAIHVSGGTSTNAWVTIAPTGSPQAQFADLAASVKKVVNVPVICVGRITEPWMAESIIAQGKTDMVAMARALLADPEWPNKVKTGRWEDIAPCVGDTQCLIQVVFGHPVSCLINPAAGKDRQMEIVPTKTPKKVLVVGGGPGGMEAARTAALRGHKVTLMEKSAKLGGQLHLAAFAPMKQEYTLAIQYLANQVQKSGVRVELNREVIVEDILKSGTDVVVVATGGLAIMPSEILGIQGQNVVSAWDVLSGRVFPGPNVVIIGGGKVGCEAADYIAHPVDDMNPMGNKVTVLEMLPHVIMDDFSPWRTVLIQRLQNKGVKIITEAKVIEILADGVKYDKNGKQEILKGLNHVVVSMGTRSNNPFGEKLKRGSFEVHVIGDAKEPRDAMKAIAEGAEVGRRI